MNNPEKYYILMQPVSDEFDHVRGVLDVLHDKKTSISIYKNEKLENNIAYKMFKTNSVYFNYFVCTILLYLIN